MPRAGGGIEPPLHHLLFLFLNYFFGDSGTAFGAKQVGSITLQELPSKTTDETSYNGSSATPLGLLRYLLLRRLRHQSTLT